MAPSLYSFFILIFCIYFLSIAWYTIPERKIYERNGDLEEKKSNHGGRRVGAGRPVGSTKEITKKLYTFRLSEEENIAVRELLKKMRNKQ